MNLVIQPNMTLFEFHTKVLAKYNELVLQNDNTGATTRLVEQYIHQLQLVPSLDIYTSIYDRDISSIINEHGYVLASSKFMSKHNNIFADMYKDLTILDPSKTIILQVCPS